jgi:hypothetical protein
MKDITRHFDISDDYFIRFQPKPDIDTLELATIISNFLFNCGKGVHSCTTSESFKDSIRQRYKDHFGGSVSTSESPSESLP